MASVLVLQDTEHRIGVSMSNEGTSPIPESVNVSVPDGDNVTMSIDEMYALYALLGQAIEADKRIRKDNPDARR